MINGNMTLDQLLEYIYNDPRKYDIPLWLVDLAESIIKLNKG